MGSRDVVVVGASAGGIEALRVLVAALPADLPATVLVVLHVPASGADALSRILDRAGPLPARRARHGDPLEPGTLLVAAPDHHLMVVDGRVALSRGPRENGHRPAVDVLFRSAARARGPRCIGVVLSGALDDGSAGLLAISRHGGVAVVQDPADALHPGMPASAIAAAAPAHVVPVAELGALLTRLVTEPVDLPDEVVAEQDLLDAETAQAELDLARMAGHEHPGVPAGFACPDCSGTLWRIEEDGFLRFRCRVGHAWTAQGLLAQQDQALESALWMALRSLEEKADLARDMGHRAHASEHELTAARFAQHADEAGRAAALVRDMLLAVGRPEQDAG